MIEQAQLPPTAVDIEKATLGMCLQNDECLKVSMEILNPKMFYQESHQIIFKSITALATTKMQVDILTVVEQLKHSKELEKGGGAYYITQLTNRVTGWGNVEQYCRIIQEMYLKRQSIALGHSLLQKGHDPAEDCFDILDHAKNTLKMLEATVSSNIIVDNKQTIDGVLADINTAKSNGGIIGYSTGIKSLDIGIMGLRGGLKYVIGADSSAGKTSLAKNICINLAHRQNLPGVFFSMEMPRSQFMLNCISEILEIPNNRLQQGNVTEAEKIRIESLKQTFFSKNFLIDDRGGLSPTDMRASVRKLVESHDIKWFAYDYLGLMKLKGNQRGKSDESMISEITAEMKNIMKEFDLIGIELSQVKRDKDSKDKRPKLYHLKGSGSIEANADVVILIYRPEIYGIKTMNGTMSTEGYAELILGKNRFGATKVLIAKYTGNLTKFSDDERGTEIEYLPENEQDSNDF